MKKTIKKNSKNTQSIKSFISFNTKCYSFSEEDLLKNYRAEKNAERRTQGKKLYPTDKGIEREKWCKQVSHQRSPFIERCTGFCSWAIMIVNCGLVTKNIQANENDICSESAR